jgi:uncharacterized damage-inducible protein DinB
MENQLSELFRTAATARLQQFCGRIKECVDKLSEEQVWARGSENENAIGNLMLHLAGNVRQWILSGVAGQPDHRKRDIEFDTRGEVGKDEMVTKLTNTVNEACAAIASLTPAQLLERRTIQNYEGSVLEAVFHVVEHFAQHTAQIVFATKMLTHEDMGFYRHLGKGARAAHTEKTP